MNAIPICNKRNNNDSDEDSDTEIELPQKINSKPLEETTNENNLDHAVLQEDEQYSCCSVNRQFNVKWCTKSNNIRNAGRQSPSNVAEEPIGPLGPAKSVTTPLEAWGIFIKDKFLEKIVTNTNKKLKSK